MSTEQIVNYRTNRKVDPIAAEAGRSFLGRGEDAQAADDPLDSAEMDALFRRLYGFLLRELDLQADNRLQIAADHAYYDHIQYTQDELQELSDRGQAPTVYNKVATAVNWILGTERRNRVDWKILARKKDGLKPAERLTALLKYVADVNRCSFERSRAFADMVKGGIGWLEDGAQDADADSPLLYSRHVNWREMIHDSASRRPDQQDWRYVFRQKWLDTDVAEMINPQRAWVVPRSTQDAERMGGSLWWTDDMPDQEEMLGYHGSAGTDAIHTRQRVRVFECWYRIPAKVQILQGGQFHREQYDQANPLHQAAVDAGLCHIAERRQMQVRVAIFTTSGLLYEGPSPYKHNRFPYTAMVAYQRDKDGMFYGAVRGIRDPQDALNKRMSKALYVLSTNKVVMERGAIKDKNKLRREIAQPDSIIEVEPGKKFDLNTDRELAAAHLQLAQIDAQMIQDVSGVTDENLGRKTNATSGVAIEARQDQGSMATSELFDNARLAFQLQGELQLSMIQQFFTDEFEFRITNTKGGVDFERVNDGSPEGDILRHKADFIISEQDYRASTRQAQVEMLLDLAARLPPEIALGMLDLIVELMDVPNRDELVQRIRKVSGQRDPEAEITPEEKAAQEEQQRQQQEQAALAKRMGLAEVELAEAKAQEARNKAELQPVIDTLQNLMKIQGKEYALALEQQELRFAERFSRLEKAVQPTPTKEQSSHVVE